MATRNPGYYTGDKAEYVRSMFAGIARRYDLLNSILSFSRHRAWRRHAVKLADLRPGDSALDVCSGTGDFAFELKRAVGPTGQVIGSDFCLPMLRAAPRRIRQSGVTQMAADALHLPYRSNLFDCITVGFGIRNVADVEQAFREMARVAAPGGRVVCLEFSRPRNPILRGPILFYEERILPRIGALITGSNAYTYLNKSIQAFNTREELKAIMEAAGLSNIRTHDLNFGAVCIHIGAKP